MSLQRMVHVAKGGSVLFRGTERQQAVAPLPRDVRNFFAHGLHVFLIADQNKDPQRE